MCFFFFCVYPHLPFLPTAAQQKALEHSVFFIPEERLSPSQQPPSPAVKSSQRVVTLAQHISVSLFVVVFFWVRVVFRGNESRLSNNPFFLFLFQEVIKKDYMRQSQQVQAGGQPVFGYHSSPVLDLTRPPSAPQTPSEPSVSSRFTPEGSVGDRLRDRYGDVYPIPEIIILIRIE